MSVTKTAKEALNKSDLLMVILLHRHGARLPKADQMFPNYPYQDNKYYPFGDAALTAHGKNQMLSLGKRLRVRYDGFLSPMFNSSEAQSYTSDTDRTKMSAQLVLAGLFPPTGDQIWNPEYKCWQPIPYTTLSSRDDRLLVGPSSYCPYFDDIYTEEAVKSPFSECVQEKYKDVLDVLRANCGHKRMTIRKAYNIYDSLRSTLNFEPNTDKPLPEWSKDIYPQPLEQLACYEYVYMTYSPFLKTLSAGGLARFLQLKMEHKIQGLDHRKFVMLSGHESTIAFHLAAMDLYDHRFPEYASYIIWELYCNDGNYTVSISYHNTIDPEIKELARMSFEEFNALIDSITQKLSVQNMVYNLFFNLHNINKKIY